MSRRAFAAVEKSFAAETASAFEFLTNELGLAGPELQGVVLPVIAYVGGTVRYRIMLDSEEMRVMTRVAMDLGPKRLVAELPDLVRAAGLGAPNHVAGSASSVHNLRRALASQAGYVRLLQPNLRPENVVELMRAANAREWNIR